MRIQEIANRFVGKLGGRTFAQGSVNKSLIIWSLRRTTTCGSVPDIWSHCKKYAALGVTIAGYVWSRGRANALTAR